MPKLEPFWDYGETIPDRKGRVIDGIFVKEEDL